MAETRVPRRAAGLRLAQFLEIDPEPDGLKAGAKIVFPQPQRARDAVAWTDEERDPVEQIIALRPFFPEYTCLSDQ
jgi:hypothetical protein